MVKITSLSSGNGRQLLKPVTLRLWLYLERLDDFKVQGPSKHKVNVNIIFDHSFQLYCLLLPHVQPFHHSHLNQDHNSGFCHCWDLYCHSLHLEVKFYYLVLGSQRLISPASGDKCLALLRSYSRVSRSSMFCLSLEAGLSSSSATILSPLDPYWLD